MDAKEFLNKVSSLIDESPTSVMATTDENGKPHIRWMIPTVLTDSPGLLYAVTNPDDEKVKQIEANPHAEWLFQKRDLSEILNVGGTTRVLDNPSLMAQVVERLGRKIQFFWKYNEETYDFHVIETVIEKGVYYKPINGHKEFISIQTEE
jgi:general stress protein 26